MAEIKKGDVVQLKSGGPEMTIQEMGSYLESAGIQNGADCVWFDGKKPMSKVFDVVVLEKIDS